MKTPINLASVLSILAISLSYSLHSVAVNSNEKIVREKSDNSCERLLEASGPGFKNAHLSPPLRDVHPAFSPTARNIYYVYEDTCLGIYFKQGPYGGPSARANKVEQFYLSYNPACYGPWSLHHQIFGNRPILMNVISQPENFASEAIMIEGDEVMIFNIPRNGNVDDLSESNTAMLIVSRDTGKIYGYGKKNGNPVIGFLNDVYSEYVGRRSQAYGVWYNSDAKKPLPWFVEQGE